MVIKVVCVYVQELDELKVMYEQQQAEQHEVSQPQSPATSAHQQDELISQLTDQVQQARQDLAGQRARTMALQQVCDVKATCIVVVQALD